MRRLLILAAFIALGFVVARARRAAPVPEADHDPWPAAPQLADKAWLEPIDGESPPTHPVKAKISSGIYHVPGGAMYTRTRPDRWYRDAASAEADGLRAAKR
jgi:hypothetical protein